MPDVLNLDFVHDPLSPAIAQVSAISRRLAAGAAARDAARILVHDEIREVAQSGLLAVRVPESFGGPGGSLTDVIRLLFELSRGDPNVAQAVLPHFTIVESVVVRGIAGQRERFAAAILGGALFGGAFAERGGKFIGDTRIVLETTEDGYRLNGDKHYSTGALYADYITTAAGTANGSRYFITVPRDREGVQLIDDWNGMGQRMTGSGTTRFVNVRISSDELTPIDMFGQKRSYFCAYAQLAHAAIDAGIAVAALDDACIANRTVGRPLPESGVEHSYDDPYVLHAIGEFALAANMAAAMLERGALLLDRAASAYLADAPSHDLSVAALVAVAEARAATDAAAIAIGSGLYRVAGASATDRALNLDRHWRNARTHTQHDPVSYKYKVVGDWHLNGRSPPNNGKN